MFILNIQNWKIVNKESYFEYILNIKDWQYIIKEYKKTRTSDQNNYLRGWVYKTIADTMWEWKDYIHWVMWMKFLVDNSKKSPYIKSTANLTTSEFSEYIENIKNFVSQFGIIIPSAEEYNQLIQ